MRFINFLGETRDRKNMIMTSTDGVYYTVSKEEVLLVLQAIAESRMHYTTIEERQQMLHYDLSPRKEKQPINEAPSDEDVSALRGLVENLEAILSAPEDADPADAQSTPARSKIKSFFDHLDAVTEYSLNRKAITEALRRSQSHATEKLGDVIAKVQSRLSDVLEERGPVLDTVQECMVQAAKTVTVKEAEQDGTLKVIVDLLIKTGKCSPELTAIYISIPEENQETILSYYLTFIKTNAKAFSDLTVEQAVQKSSVMWMNMVGKFL